MTEQEKKLKKRIMNTDKTSLENESQSFFVMFKIIGGVKQVEFELKAISDHHAILVANDFHYRNGLIGRYYCETSNGKTFSVS